MEPLTTPPSLTAPSKNALRDVVDLLQLLSTTTTTEDVLKLLAQRLPTLLPVSDRVSIVFREADDEWMRVYRVVPYLGVPNPLPRVRIEGTPVGQSVLNGASLAVGDVRGDRNITFGHASKDSIRSTVSVPIFIAGRAVGAMNMGSTIAGTCTDAMVGRLQDIASCVGPALLAAEQNAARTSRPQIDDDNSALVGKSDAFRRLMQRAFRASQSDANIVITGETGVGKTALARAIHSWSARRERAFVTMHLGALSPSLIESEMFGHERGAFTGATQRRIGRFEAAIGGTLFIDELGDTPPGVQAKILRVVQDGSFERVGGNVSVCTDARLITATNNDLDAAVRNGAFREDLLHRLKVLPLHVPPLRDRGHDVTLLAEGILGRLSAKLERQLTLSPAGWRKLRQYSWPGNIRELETSLQRAAALEAKDALDLEDVNDTPLPLEHDDWPTMKESQRRYVQRVLEHTAGVIEGPAGAAQLLGLRPSTLRSQMKRLGMMQSERSES